MWAVSSRGRTYGQPSYSRLSARLCYAPVASPWSLNSERFITTLVRSVALGVDKERVQRKLVLEVYLGLPVGLPAGFWKWRGLVSEWWY